MSGSTRLKLFPVAVTPAADRFLVVRRDTRRMLQTSESGAESIRLLGKGLTIDEVRAAVGRKYECDSSEVDIDPLVECLLREDFVEVIDGRTISVRQSAPWRLGRALWDPAMRAWALSVLLGWAPAAVSTRVLLRRGRSGADPVLLERIRSNLASATALCPPEAVEGVAKANYDGLCAFYLERTLLAALPPAKLHRWMRHGVRVDGLARLARSRARGRGALLCAAHVAAYSVIPFALAARGHDTVVLMDATEDSEREVRARLAAIRRAGFEYGIEPVPSGASPRVLVRALEQGRTVLLLIDPVAPAGSSVTVPFLGGWLRVPSGPARLARRTGADVLSVSVATRGTGCYDIEIHEPVSATMRATERQLLAALAGTLERDVRRRPEAWLGWKDYHVLSAVDPASTTGASHA